MDIARARERTSLIAFAAAMLISLPLIAGFFGSAHPALDSLAHFRVHLAALIILFAVLALVGSMWRQGLAAIVFGLAAIGTAFGIHVFPGAGGQANAAFHPKDDGAPVYRLLHMNLRFDNREPGKVLSMIGRLRPDVLTLNEVSVMWRAKLGLLDGYPYRIVCDIPNRAGGVAILSLRPLAQGDEPKCLHGGTMALATIDFGGKAVQVGALHLHWPWPFSQPYQIDGLEAPLRKMAETALLAGDLNATPWSHAARRIAEAGSFQPVRVAGPTWLHRRLPESLRFAGLPIDQIFAKGDVLAHSARTMEAAGSDHLPVLVEFSLRRPDNAPAENAPTAMARNSAAVEPG